ncbi:hypothetical protein RFI_13477, partial [Reticulomyxa filosa]
RTREQLEKRIKELEDLIVELQNRLKAKNSRTNSDGPSNTEYVVVKDTCDEEQVRKTVQLTEELEAMKLTLDNKKELIQVFFFICLFQLGDDVKSKEEIIGELSRRCDENKKLQATLVCKDEQMKRLHEQFQLVNDKLNAQTQQLNAQSVLDTSLARDNDHLQSIFDHPFKAIVATLHQMVCAFFFFFFDDSPKVEKHYFFF